MKYRKKVSRRKGRKMLKKAYTHTNSMNIKPMPMRGGIRL